MKLKIVTLVFLATAAAHAAGAGEVGFSAVPQATTADGKVKISFSVKASSDVEVAILDAGGKVVRHLAAGVLGANPPEPFRKGLSQELVWDGKDDAGKPVTGAKVRVSLGLRPRLHRIIGWSGQNVDNPQGIACGADGTLYIAFGSNLTAHAFSTVVCAYDPEGKYLRQVIPASPALPAPKRKGWPWMSAEGIGEMPIVHHALSRSTYPAFSVDYDCFPAVAPDGSFLVLNDANGRVKHSDIGSGRILLTVGRDGSVPADYKARRIAGLDHRGSGHVAVSPDGKYAYVSGFSVRKKGACNTIWRTPLDRVGPAEIFAGRSFRKPEKPADLADPQGLDTDRDGNVYVADRGRGRIAVFRKDGTFLAGIPLKDVYQVQVSSKTGAIFATVASRSSRGRWGTSRIVKLGGIKDPKLKASLPVPDKYGRGIGRLALDDSGATDRLWYCGFVWGNYRLYRIADEGTRLKVLDRPLQKLGGRDSKHSLPFSDQVSVVGNKVLGGHPGFGQRTAVYYRAFDAETGKPAGLYYPSIKPGKKPRFHDLVYGDTRGGPDGLFYIYTGSKVRRFDEKGKLVPFGKTGKKAIGKAGKTEMPTATPAFTGHPHTRGSGMFVTRRGEVYLTTMPMFFKDPKKRSGHTYGGNFVRKFTPDGALAPKPLIVSPEAHLAGIAVDSRGNIYVGAQAAKGGQRTPEFLRKALPARLGKQARHMYELFGSIVKFPPTGGAIVPDAKGEYKAGYFRFGKKYTLKNALWARRGGLIPTKYDLGCYCETSRFDIDRFDRLFVPDPLTFSILVLDTAGNRIARFGSFGNMDCRGKGSPVPEPEITFGWPTQVDCALGRVYTADLVNRRIVSVRFEHAASAECGL